LKIEKVPFPEWENRLLPEWGTLLEDAAEPSIFLSPEWIIVWQRHFGAGVEPFLLIARDPSGRLSGLAPLCRRRLRPAGLSGPHLLSFLSAEGVGSEYLGVLARPGSEAEFVRSVARELADQWTLADLRGLREGTRSSELIPAAFGSRAPGRIHRERHPCSVLRLPADYEEFLTSLASKFRTTLRYRTNKLVKNFDVKLVRTLREEELDGQLARLFEMHQERWEAEGHSGSFYQPRKRSFYREISAAFLRHGWLRFYHLQVDGVIRASQFGFAYRGVLHSLQEAFDYRFRPPGVGGVGVVLRGMAIRESIAEGLTSYDFLGGDEEFKTRWGTTTHYVQRVRLGAPGPAGALAFLWAAGGRDARLWVRTHLPPWMVTTRDRWRTRRQARRARRLESAQHGGGTSAARLEEDGGEVSK
jgi:CelD/BcsL family acetyltransferase involved in cellulose biosynthesis